MIEQKSKKQADKDLDETLKETFPASDAPATNEPEIEPVRPANRKPAVIDMALVERLARRVEQRKQGNDREK